MASWGWLLAVAGVVTAQPAAAQPVETDGVDQVMLRLPTHGPFLLTIVDERLVGGDGERATFTVQHILRFTEAAAGGWGASIEQQRISCAGPADVCAAFTTVMAARTGVTGRFSIAANGAIEALGPPPAPRLMPAPGTVGANAALIVASREADAPGGMAGAELREALRFVGAPVRAEPATTVAADTLTPGGDGATWQARESRAVDSGSGHAAIARTATSSIDRTTGLVTNSVTETRRMSGNGDGQWLGTRRWTLAPVAQVP